MGVSSKKSSKGTSKEVKDNQVKGHTDAAPYQSKKRSGDEIDEIFSSKKSKKTRVAVPNKDVKGKSIEKMKKNEMLTGAGAQRHQSSKSNTNNDDKEKRVKRSNKLPADGDLFGDSSKQRKKTSGLKIYSEEELGLNKPDAGGTPLCPFDCDCCF